MDSIYAYIAQDAPDRARQWAFGLLDAIDSLKTFPSRCALARESRFFPYEMRQLLYGKGRNVYRILFTVGEDIVSILHIRHSAQDTLKPDE